jgi:hypothetical protein
LTLSNDLRLQLQRMKLNWKQVMQTRCCVISCNSKINNLSENAKLSIFAKLFSNEIVFKVEQYETYSIINILDISYTVDATFCDRSQLVLSFNVLVFSFGWCDQFSKKNS